MKFHLDNNIVEGTPEELVKYQELLEDKEREAELLKSGHMHQPSEQEFQDTFRGIFGSVKVKDSYTESTKISTDEEDIKGYAFWYLEGSTFDNRAVLKTTLGTLGHYFEDSKGRRYSYQSVHGLIKPINRGNAHEEFEEAKHRDMLLLYYPALDVFSWEG